MSAVNDFAALVESFEAVVQAEYRAARDSEFGRGYNAAKNKQRRDTQKEGAEWYEGFDTYTKLQPNNFIAERSCETDSTALGTFLTPGATLIPVCSFKRLAGTFEGVVVDYGLGAAKRFVGLVVVRGGDGDGPRVLWDLSFQSLSNASYSAMEACRELAAQSE
jgi:hypothetical protein